MVRYAVRILAVVSIGTLLMMQNVIAGEIVELTMPVRGMFCSSCASNVEKALRGLDGVADVRVEQTRDRVWVRFSPDRVTPRRMAETLRKWGYDLQLPRQNEPRQVR